MSVFMKLRLGSLVALCFVMMVFMSSCVRDYICRCETVYTGQPGMPDTLVKEYDVTDTKKNAKADCVNASNSSEKDGIKTVETCDLY
jgi:hypothetical protein